MIINIISNYLYLLQVIKDRKENFKLFNNHKSDANKNEIEGKRYKVMWDMFM